MTSTPDRVPHALLHNLKHNKVLHERVVFLTVVIARRAVRAASTSASRSSRWAATSTRSLAYYGFKEDPDVPELLEESRPARASRST